ncbi:MAG: M20/M25/M40 family metallo-hydrolase [Phycisphaerales bacterium]|nr:M20/M25/M40 family metallo-hydrolase [Phycisphaerales bacterium]
MLAPVLKQLDIDHEHALQRLKEYLSIPSISAQAEHAGHIRQAAAWTAAQLEAAGLKVQILETTGGGKSGAEHAAGHGTGHPVVLAHSDPEQVMNPHGKRVLFYGHYDVQPPEPLQDWITPPFEPTVRDGAIYARGASDDKGQVHGFLEALRAWKQTTGKLPGPVTVLIEGEEEIGSVNLPSLLERHKNELKADIVVVSDTHMWDKNTPAITYGLRGLLYYDVQISNASRDVHSGMYGGMFANPAVVLTRILSQLWDEDQRVALPGFYDDVVDPTQEELTMWAELGFDEVRELAEVGVREPYGEAGFETLVRNWARPSCDVNGLYGGYGGAGAKTIIPSFAGAKVSFRLAPKQKAQRVANSFDRWWSSRIYPAVRSNSRTWAGVMVWYCRRIRHG